MRIDETSFNIILDAEQRTGKLYSEEIGWYDEENIDGAIDPEVLLEIIYDMTKEIDGLHELIREMNSENDI